ncbi:MAG: serine/threonine protein kinase [Deltaproteobacteria bacterium]|nr:serine/threonine protein kinase [Deltaproteobacteria bacterium]
MTTSQMNIRPINPDDPLVGVVLAGRYVVKSRIGEGGMGLVYEGLHRDIDKRVAIKILRDDLSRRPEVVARFRQEAKSASRIGHENIVDISDFGETTRGASYFVMEFLDGEDLANVLGRDVTVDAGRVCAIVLQCCRALSATHAKGIVLTKTGMIFGTPEYMSPEQAAGKDLDHRVDVYALGIILYECLAGRVPFEGDTFMGVLTQHLFAELPPIVDLNPKATVSRELETVIRKALAKDPDDRYQDTEELAEAITCALDGRLSRATVKTPPSAFGPPSLGYLDPVSRRKTSRWVWAVTVSAVVAALTWVSLGPLSGQGSEAGASETQAGSSPVAETVEAAEPLLADVEPALTFVNVHVATDPAGARVLLDNGLEACATTPCTVEAERGSTLVLRARLGKRRGRTAVTPTQEETVLIELRAPKKTPAMPRNAQAPKRKREKPARSSDLKVPEWAQ